MLRQFFKNRIARNATWIIACKLAECVIGLAISMLTARYFGPANFGLINFAAGIAMFASPVAALGLDVTLVQELVRDPDREGEIMGTAIATSLVSSGLCVLGIGIGIRAFLPDSRLTLTVCVLYSLMLLTRATELMQYWFQAKLLNKYTAIFTLIAYAAVSGLQVALVAMGKSVEWFAAMKAVEYAIVSAGLMIEYRRSGGQRLRFSRQRRRQLLRNSRPYILSSVLLMMYIQTDRLMIRGMLGDTRLGFYSAAITAAMIAEFVYLAIINSFKPVILSDRLRDKSAFETDMRRLYALIICLSALQGILVTALAKWIILVLYGRDYLPAVNTLRILVWYSMAANIGSVRMVWIVAEEKQNIVWKITLCGVILNAILNVILIRAWGINGAAIASFCSQVFTNIVIGYIMKVLWGNNRLMMQAVHPRFIIQEIRQLTAHRFEGR